MTYNMDMELKYGLMVCNMKVNIFQVKNMGKANLHGKMEVLMMGNLKITRFVVLEYTNGLMANLTKGSGLKIKCMAKEKFNTQISLHMKEILKKI